MDYQTFLEFFGYAASVLVAISLMMSSIIKLRWYNLVGAVCFSTYGFLIGALPVGFLNLFIALVDVYYLYKIYTEKEYLQILEIDSSSKYLERFLKFHQKEIQEYFPNFTKENQNTAFFVLRNMNPAGLFLGNKEADTLKIDIDYVIPQFRDFKIGSFLFKENKVFFEKLGIKKFSATESIKKHNDYLTKMGFTKNEDSKSYERLI